jgi:hypothetical protein
MKDTRLNTGIKLMARRVDGKIVSTTIDNTSEIVILGILTVLVLLGIIILG